MPVNPRVASLACLATLLPDTAAIAQRCGFRPAFTRADERGTRRVQVFEGEPDPRIGGARTLLFVSALKVNTDGTRLSYNVDDPRALTRAINDVRNAMQRGGAIADFEAVARAGWPLPRTWQVLLPGVIEKSRATGKPCVDRDGYLVSKTSEVAVDGGFARDGDCDQAKWLDALTVGALVLPRGATEFTARQADNRTPVIAMTLGPAHNLAFGIVGDKGPADELGEASVAFNRALNGLPADATPVSNADAVRRFQAPRSAVLLFPGASLRLARPLDGGGVATRVGDLFTRWGGKQRLEQCLAEVPDAH